MYLGYEESLWEESQSGICWLPRTKNVFLLNIWMFLLSPGVASSHANTPSNGHCFCQAHLLRLHLSFICYFLHKTQRLKTTCCKQTQVVFENLEKLCDNKTLDCEKQVFVKVLFSPYLGDWKRYGYLCRNAIPIFQEVPFFCHREVLKVILLTMIWQSLKKGIFSTGKLAGKLLNLKYTLRTRALQ